MSHAIRIPSLILISGALSACARHGEAPARETAPARIAGTAVVVRDTVITATFDAAGTAVAMRQAILSTKLMATVDEVTVHEGDLVREGQVLARLDARDLAAKHAQLSASIAEAEAMQRDATTQAGRIRALYADSAATKAQLDAAVVGLARSDAAVRAAHAAAQELDAMAEYAVVRAPFAGMITKRYVDPGAFAAPGAPLIGIQDVGRLRITATVPPDVAAGMHRGASLDALIETRPARALVEGVVPATAANLVTINAIVANGTATLLPGSAANLSIPLGPRHAVVVPSAAVVRQGDLTGVTLRTAGGDDVRWVRLGRALGPRGALVEVASGLRPGDTIVIPTGASNKAGD